MQGKAMGIQESGGNPQKALAFNPQNSYFLRQKRQAEVVKLVDAHGSGPCGLKPVGVQLPPSAPNLPCSHTCFYSSRPRAEMAADSIPIKFHLILLIFTSASGSGLRSCSPSPNEKKTISATRQFQHNRCDFPFQSRNYLSTLNPELHNSKYSFDLRCSSLQGDEARRPTISACAVAKQTGDAIALSKYPFFPPCRPGYHLPFAAASWQPKQSGKNVGIRDFSLA